MPRLFVGVAAREALATDDVLRQAETVGPLKRVDPSLYHVTVAFLGDTPDERVDLAAEALHEGAQGIVASRGTVRGLGAFPKPSRAKVLWAGIEGAPLDAVAAGVRGALRERKFSFDDRAFHAHLTLARSKQALDLDALVERNRTTTFGPFPADRVALFASTLTPQGPEYEVLATAALEGAT